jgi:enolase
MAIQLAPLVGAGLGALQQSKIDKALAGEKTYTKPKTLFGKLIGGVSGRTAAAEASASVKTAPLSESVMNSLQPSAKSTPITGGISFGGEAKQKTYLPFAIIAGVVAVFYFLFGKKKRGGRRR